MRVSIILFLVAIYHGFHGVECDINFPLAGATANTYKTFIANLRQQLSIDTQKVYNITVLKHQVAAPNQRFLLIHLSNYDQKTITLGIDVFDVYLVGYLTGTNSYIFKEAPALAYTNTLFPGSRRTNLTYSGSYIDLERNGQGRENISLGFPPLDSAITNLFLYEATSLRRAFLVVIQMISEAARFKYIETTVANNAVSGTYKPDPAFLSLENEWGALSKQIQRAQNNGGIFPTPVVLKTVSGNRLEVKNVSDPVVKGVALMKYERLGSVIVDKELHDELR